MTQHPRLCFLGHSTVRVEIGDRVVLTDPVLGRNVGPLRRVGPLPGPDTWAGVDVVLISHLHGDHLHLPSLRRLGRATRILVPRGAAGWLRAKGFSAVEELAAGETWTDGALEVTGVRAVHSGHRWGPRLTRGPDAPAIGHLLQSGSTSVYVAGDTDVYPQMAQLAAQPPGRRLDVALLPVWGWGPNLGPGHMDPDRAAEAVRLLRPVVAVPVHWGTLALSGMTTLPSPMRRRMRDLLVSPPQRFADAVSRAGLDTTVVIAEPGSYVDLPDPVRR